MRVIDFFCGAGGFSEGFERAGFEIIKAYDIWSPAILTHNLNHGGNKDVAIKGDVFEISMMDDEEFEKCVPDSEVIIGSPPCIAFSNSNKSGKADKKEGIKLINAFLRIIARKMNKPNSKLIYWVMENVENSKGFIKDNYNSVDLEWDELGDFVLEIPRKNVFNMKYFGVPTNRKRFICGNYPELMNLNGDEGLINLGEILSSLGKPRPNDYQNSIRIIKDPIYGMEIREKELTDHHYIKEIPSFEWQKAKRQKIDKGYMGKMSFPENKEKPARTIMATLSGSSRESMIFEMEGFAKRYRFPTIREVATLMSFPIDFRFYGESDSVKYRMIGNAVTPKFAYEIARVMRLVINPDFGKDKFECIKNFNEETPFTNLNGTQFPLKVEKPKKYLSNYKYHVPQLIENSFRVGLENNFEGEDVKWKTVIHYSQGKNARKYEDVFINLAIFRDEEIIKTKTFITECIDKIGSHEYLQVEYCKTMKQRSGIGPDELLNKIREFIDSFNSLNRYIYVEGIERAVSMKIITSYYILQNILRGIISG